jgi:hypothetical protein
MIDWSRKMRKAGPICVASWLFFVPAAFGQAALEHPAVSNVPTSSPVTSSPVIVIGFVGGFVRHDDLVHGTALLGARLRSEYPFGVAVQVFENHREDEAYHEVLRLLDVDHDGALSPAEKQNARIVIFGHSWGGSETVNLARQLEKDGVPVLLTIQVDSISKMGQNDGVIPANVGQAANFYQPDGVLHGRPEIRAADPERTKIIGNFRFDYKANPVRCDQYPLRDRILTKTHTEIECDPKVWGQVESLIRSKLPTEARGY